MLFAVVVIGSNCHLSVS